MATILDPRTGEAWDVVKGVWRQLHGGINRVCSNPECGVQFQGGAFAGERTGKPYCSRACREEMSDAPTMESLARSTP